MRDLSLGKVLEIIEFCLSSRSRGKGELVAGIWEGLGVGFWWGEEDMEVRGVEMLYCRFYRFVFDWFWCLIRGRLCWEYGLEE